jgi:hypothetical protein
VRVGETLPSTSRRVNRRQLMLLTEDGAGGSDSSSFTSVAVNPRQLILRYARDPNAS